jgi:hypothetical protein
MPLRVAERTDLTSLTSTKDCCWNRNLTQPLNASQMKLKVSVLPLVLDQAKVFLMKAMADWAINSNLMTVNMLVKSTLNFSGISTMRLNELWDASVSVMPPFNVLLARQTSI